MPASRTANTSFASEARKIFCVSTMLSTAPS
eukprot:CAMPEP_0168503604 /NCGR_PEP_ID=MMETSP0228-20121227/75945_1 /TAXON_ID=133427 /ORGANISM="Protoceratium reticulatum, Strain CCCM 535 (=CCMP 1889)" /LENGTH=30 /DNA_ID= /DNA_START= /DNA_END= /DNA_ORIENTATION=